MSNPWAASIVLVLAFSLFPVFVGVIWGRFTREEPPSLDRIGIVVIGVLVLTAEVLIMWLYLTLGT